MSEGTFGKIFIGTREGNVKESFKDFFFIIENARVFIQKKKYEETRAGIPEKIPGVFQKHFEVKILFTFSIFRKFPKVIFGGVLWKIFLEILSEIRFEISQKKCPRALLKHLLWTSFRIAPCMPSKNSVSNLPRFLPKTTPVLFISIPSRIFQEISLKNLLE